VQVPALSREVLSKEVLVWVPILGVTQKKKQFGGEKIPKRAALEREAVSRIQEFFNPRNPLSGRKCTVYQWNGREINCTAPQFLRRPAFLP
jgi:hypothetical protein